MLSISIIAPCFGVLSFFLSRGGRKIMMRSKIEIKKIQNITTRQVTFSKRKRGLFKKAQELSTLCDAEIGIILFSSTSRFHHFSSSRMTRVVQRYMRHTGNLDQLDASLWPEPEDFAILHKEFADKNQELRLIHGEGIEGLSFEELTKLERQVEKGCTRIRQMKDDKLLKLIKGLEQKENKLKERNESLKEKITAEMGDENNSTHQSGSSSEHMDIQNNVTFDTSLTLGLV